MAGERLAGYIAGIGLIGALAINASFNDNAGTCRVNEKEGTVQTLNAKGAVVYTYDKDNVQIQNGECLIRQGGSAEPETFKLQR